MGLMLCAFPFNQFLRVNTLCMESELGVTISDFTITTSSSISFACLNKRLFLHRITELYFSLIETFSAGSNTNSYVLGTGIYSKGYFLCSSSCFVQEFYCKWSFTIYFCFLCFDKFSCFRRSGQYLSFISTHATTKAATCTMHIRKLP